MKWQVLAQLTTIYFALLYINILIITDHGVYKKK